ncbi:hypothetical protein, partial [Lysinibacillus sphaericus]|uniref:hypothetical protein n=1 Tax=Lysinibacillus sphaericus TaxID=1421 RepID=UPI001E2D7AEB
ALKYRSPLLIVGFPYVIQLIHFFFCSIIFSSERACFFMILYPSKAEDVILYSLAMSARYLPFS